MPTPAAQARPARNGTSRGQARTRGLGGMAGSIASLPVKARLERLMRIARGRRRGLILTHDNPDPDSLASAVALAFLLEQRAGVECRVAYGGIIGRAEN